MAGDKIPIGLTFDDVLLEPRKSKVVPSQARLETKLTKKIKLKIPVLAAAMDTVSGPEMAITLGKLGGLGVLHRNNTIKQQIRMLKEVQKHKVLTAAAISPLDIERALQLDRAGVDVIVVDCAHIHNQDAFKGAKKIKQKVKAEVAAGNLASAEAAREVARFADAVKVGVGPGSICTTRVVAGIGVPQLTAVLNAVKAVRGRVPVIADGGIKNSGDAVKALAAGASSIMLGSMLAGTDEAPGKTITKNGKRYKSYRGMGSFAAMSEGRSADRYFQKGAKKYVAEGVEGLVPYKGTLEEVIFEILGGIRSGMGYIGAATITEMPKQAKFIRITNAGLKESRPHSIIRQEQ